MRVLALVCLSTVVLAATAQAELLGPVSLSPVGNSYLASGANQTPAAWTYTGDADVWQIDLSSFSGGANVEVSTWDWFVGYPDDYDMYWNDAYVGNSWTGNPGIGNVFNVRGTAGVNLLRVEYVNKHSGIAPDGNGSLYWMSVRANPVPEPATVAALGLGAVALLRRRRKG